MKNIAIQSSNNRFFKVQEEIKNFLSIIMGNIEESAQEEQDFEHFMQNAASQEEASQIQELKESSSRLDRKAQNYQQNIGIPTRKTQPRTSKKNVPEEHTTFNTIKPISPKTISNDSIHRIMDDFNSER